MSFQIDVAPRKTAKRSMMNEISESERVMDNSVTCRMERDAAEGMARKTTANAMIPWNMRSRKMPFNVIKIIELKPCLPVHLKMFFRYSIKQPRPEFFLYHVLP